MRIILFFVSLFAAVAARSEGTQAFELRGWSINLPEEAKVSRMKSGDSEVALIEIGGRKYSMIAQEAPPQSERSIKSRIREVSGKTESLRTQKVGPGNTVFQFSHGDQTDWYSTKGGKLQLTSTGQEKAEIGVTRK